MTENEITDVISRIEGTWGKFSPEKLRAWSEWLERRDITVHDCFAAVRSMVDSGAKFVTIPAFLGALRAVGAVRREMGNGDAAVVDDMANRIMDFAVPAADREGASVNDRLRREQAQTREFLEDAVRMGDEEGQRYYRDRLSAYRKLLSPKELAG